MTSGRVVVGSTAVHVSRASGASGAARLRRAADLLANFEHPGLVAAVTLPVPDGGELAGGDPEVPVDDAPTLVTRWVGPTIAVLGPLPAEQVAAIGAFVATTLGDLHAMGWVHADVTAEHILIGEDGRPVLCGLGGARRDPGASFADVVGLAHVLESAVEVRGHRQARRRLAGILAEARRGRMDAADLARRLADPRLEARFPDASDLGPDAAPRPPEGAAPHHTTCRRRRMAVGLALAAVVAVMVGLAGGAARTASQPPIGAAAGEGSPAQCPSADSGCRAVLLADGVLDTPAGRFRVGSGGDLAVLGRWTCSSAAPAVLAHATGAVWVYDRWAGPGQVVTARRVGTVVGATGMSVVPGAGGCDALSVSRAGKASVALSVVAP